MGAAGLPQQYAPARLVLWMNSDGLFDQRPGICPIVTGKSLDHELRNLYVSPALAQCTHRRRRSVRRDARCREHGTPSTVPDRRGHQQRRNARHIRGCPATSERTPRENSRSRSSCSTRCSSTSTTRTLKAEHIQHLVESCSSRFDSRVLVVATGQAALTANATLQKLIDRFAVSVALSDTDVENVVREVVLRKKPEADRASPRPRSKRSSGEIDQHLRGTKFEPTGADKRRCLLPTTRCFPTRRRFWERALRAIDKAGKGRRAPHAAQDRPRGRAQCRQTSLVGHVIGADFLFRSESAIMLAKRRSLEGDRRVDPRARRWVEGRSHLKSRVCALVFLIGQLPHEGIGRRRASAPPAPQIADLLVGGSRWGRRTAPPGRSRDSSRISSDERPPRQAQRRRVPPPDRGGC